MRILGFILFALLLGVGSASAWQEYVYLDQGVAIQFPANPQAMKSAYDSIFAKHLPSMVYSVEDEHVLYKLTVIDLTDRPDMGSNFLNEAGYELMRRQGSVHRFPARLSGRAVDLRRHARGRSQGREPSAQLALLPQGPALSCPGHRASRAR
jgi:hypothetical protein